MVLRLGGSICYLTPVEVRNLSLPWVYLGLIAWFLSLEKVSFKILSCQTVDIEFSILDSTDGGILLTMFCSQHNKVSYSSCSWTPYSEVHSCGNTFIWSWCSCFCFIFHSARLICRAAVLAIGWIIFLSSLIPVHFLLNGHDSLRKQIEVKGPLFSTAVSFFFSFPIVFLNLQSLLEGLYKQYITHLRVLFHCISIQLM